jgi:hypothetical protein
MSGSKVVDAPFRVKSESLRVMIFQLAAFRALTKFTRSGDLSSSELRYG